MLSIRKQFDLLLEYYIDKFQSKENIYNKRLFDYLDALRFRNKIGVACGAGRSYFTIIANGDIYSCPHFMNNSQYCIGNIATSLSENKKYTSVNVEDIQECKDCWMKYLCSGSCFAIKWLENKNTEIPSKYLCKTYDIYWRAIIKLYIQLYPVIMNGDNINFHENEA